METTHQISDLLTKFSYASTIMKYFGRYSDSQIVLTLLSRETSKMWTDFKYAFRICFLSTENINTFASSPHQREFKKKHMEHHKGFSQEFYDLLISEFRYISYLPKIKLITISQIELLSDFISKVEYPEHLQLGEVHIICKNKAPSPEILNTPFNALVSRGISTDCIKVTLPEFFKAEEYQGALEYTSELKTSIFEQADYFKKIGNLKCTISNKETAEIFFGLQTSISEISITSDIAEMLLLSEELKVPESVSSGIKKINLRVLSPTCPTKENLIQIFSNLQEIYYDFTLCRAILSRHDIYTVYTHNGSSFGRHDNEIIKEKKIRLKFNDPIIMKNLDVFYYNEESKTTTAFHVERLDLFADDKSSFYTVSHDFITLSDFTSCTYYNVSSYNEVDLVSFSDFIQAHPLPGDEVKSVVIQNTGYHKISDSNQFLFGRQKEVDQVILQKLDSLPPKKVDSLISKLSKVTIHSSLTVKAKVGNSCEALMLLTKLPITHLELSIDNSELSKISRKDRRELVEAIVGMESLQSCYLSLDFSKTKVYMRSMTAHNKRSLPGVLNSLISSALKKVPETDFLDEITVYDH
ncbi:unnamed protein product [Moneuplotes crassus]|uniref:Uncharacterized protein n=1 Tax=Euplotes crassus TaxID=5936 RepID=A0AAD1U9P3_EUPCR|nr:unnamed protein product [Moneuplotes crassus]